MARGLGKYNRLAKEILLRLAEVGLFTIAATSPYFFPSLLKKYFRKESRKHHLARQQAMRELRAKRFVACIEHRDGTVEVQLTHRGHAMIRRFKLESLTLKKPAPWDREWRVVLYDIPHRQKRASDAFREHLKQLGLFQLQKSVWVSPYECLEELEFLCGVFSLDMNRCVLYFKTPHIPREDAARSFFGL